LKAIFTRIILLALVFAMPALLAAQTSSTMTGVVVDTTGAVISGVAVVLSNPATGTEYKIFSNSAGSYRFADIPPGPGYRVVFSHDGFSPYAVDGIYMNVANSRTQNARLSPGTHEQVEVNAGGQGATINIEDATIGNNYQVQKLNDLPVQSRSSPVVLFTLQPGITLDGATTGSRTDQTNKTLDGLDVNDFATGLFTTIVGDAPVDSVQEFRGTTAGFTASSGVGGGGQFQMVTKSGTNAFHGNLNEYHRDNSTTANDWFNDNVVPVIRAPKLVRNQFGGAIGGPIKHDRLFFFFNYYNSRIAQSQAVQRVVPLPSFALGNVSYINNNPGCTASSRQNTTPGCISQLTPTQVKTMDPAGIGQSPALANLLKIYPAVNDVTGGDGVNTGTYRFNFPTPDNATNYVGRLDYNFTDRIKFFGRGTVARENLVNTAAQFPGAPAAVTQVDRSYAYVVGMNWQISNNKINQFTYGSTVQDLDSARPSNPQGVNQISFATGVTTLMANPYSNPSNAQSRHVPIPQIQDDFTWQLGRHSVSMGGTFKWIHTTSSTVLDYNSLSIGLGGHVEGLIGNLRPSNLLPSDTTAQVTYDSAFAADLGRVSSISSTFNYNAAGVALPQPSGSIRNYQYYQTQLYVSDSWKMTPHLTITYGLNYQLFSVPYEKNGLETVQSMGFDSYFSARVAQSAAGISGPNTLPFITYVLGGKANNGPNLYNPQYKDFAPRFAFVWNPSFDSKTVFNGSAGINYDRTIVNAVQYQQDQFSYLFSQPKTVNNGSATDPVGSLATDARLDHPPAAIAPATPKPPYQPYVTGGIPNGLQNGIFNEMVDPNLKTPYTLRVNFGIQHEFAGGFILKTNYVGSFGRRLLAQADANQLVEFVDKASGQLMSQAIGNITTQLRAGTSTTNVTTQPWLENQIAPGTGVAKGYANNTTFVADNLQSLLIKGDFADTIQSLSPSLGYNVGMAAQFGENTVYTNKGFSSYHGLLVTLSKNMTHGLQFDVNYTWAHSIDNVSLIANGVAYGGYGFVCDVQRPRLCRGNSDFDTTHYITGDFTYNIPFGRGRAFGSNMPWGLNEILGGWDVSGISTWHSGQAYSTMTSAYVAGFANDAPAIFNGDTSAIKRKIHKTAAGQQFLFADPTAAANAFTGPVGFQIGSRNQLRGPQLLDIDTGLSKSFPIVPSREINLKLRADAFNVLNHPNFQSPGANPPTNYQDITQPGSFGQLTALVNNNGQPTTGSPRVLQLALRLEF
jgi:hypothetical protein